MSNDFQKHPAQLRKRGEIVLKVCMTTGLLLIPRRYLQGLCHVHTEVTNLCVRFCMFDFLVSMLVKVWNIEGGNEREKSLFSTLGLVVVVELFMRLCDTTLAALGHRGNNTRVLNFGARAGNDCFITRFGQLSACWRSSRGNSWAFWCQSQWHQVGLRTTTLALFAPLLAWHMGSLKP